VEVRGLVDGCQMRTGTSAVGYRQREVLATTILFTTGRLYCTVGERCDDYRILLLDLRSSTCVPSEIRVQLRMLCVYQHHDVFTVYPNSP
jgi:hypothetical protein